MRAVRILVSGRVQGVGFRYFVAEQARALDLAGFVRNLVDGRVEALAAGPADRIDTLCDASRRGPAGSRVDSVEVSEASSQGLPHPFSINRDG